MHLFGCLIGLFIIILVLIVLAPMILLQIARSFLGSRTNSNKKTNSSQSHTQHNGTQQKKTKPNSRQRRAKIFEQSEGEYIEFTEVKE